MDVFTKESVVPDVIDAVPAAQAKVGLPLYFMLTIDIEVNFAYSPTLTI